MFHAICEYPIEIMKPIISPPALMKNPHVLLLKFITSGSSLRFHLISLEYNEKTHQISLPGEKIMAAPSPSHHKYIGGIQIYH